MRFYSRMMLATGGLSIAIVFAWVLAVLSVVGNHRHELQPAPVPRTAQRERTTTVQMPSLEAPASSRDPQASSLEPQASSLERPYVMTDIGKAYHLADSDCFYIRKQSKHTLIPLSLEEAESRGLHPCTNCLPPKIARVK